jgi:large subunit ribosomal protein L28
MAKKCALTGTGPQYGNNVSHSNRKTRRRFVPNIQVASLLSDALGRSVTLRLTVATLRTVDHNGGLDAYLLSTSGRKLTDEGRKLKAQVKKAIAAKGEPKAA